MTENCLDELYICTFCLTEQSKKVVACTRGRNLRTFHWGQFSKHGRCLEGTGESETQICWEVSTIEYAHVSARLVPGCLTYTCCGLWELLSGQVVYQKLEININDKMPTTNCIRLVHMSQVRHVPRARPPSVRNLFRGSFMLQPVGNSNRLGMGLCQCNMIIMNNYNSFI